MPRNRRVVRKRRGRARGGNTATSAPSDRDDLWIRTLSKLAGFLHSVGSSKLGFVCMVGIWRRSENKRMRNVVYANIDREKGKCSAFENSYT